MGWFDSIGGFFGGIASAVSSAVSSVASAVSSALGGESGGGGSSVGGGGGHSGGHGGSSSGGGGSRGRSGGGSRGGSSSGGGRGSGSGGGHAGSSAGGTGGHGGSSGGSAGGESGGGGGGGYSGPSGGSDWSGYALDGALVAAAQNAHAHTSGGHGARSRGGRGTTGTAGKAGKASASVSSHTGGNSGSWSSLQLDGALKRAADEHSISKHLSKHLSTKAPPNAISKHLQLDGSLKRVADEHTLHSEHNERALPTHTLTDFHKKITDNSSLQLDGALKRAADEHTRFTTSKLTKITDPPELQAYREAQKADFFRGLWDLSVPEMEAGIHSQSVQLARELRQAQSAKSPADRFVGGLKVAAEGLGLGAEEFLAGSMKLTEDLFKAPVKGAKEAIEGLTSTPEALVRASSKFVKGNPIPADELVGQFLAGAAIEGGFAKAGITTPTALSSELLVGPAGKVNTFFDRLRSGYEPELGEEINMVPAATYEPKPVEHYIDRFAGKRVTAIHMTPSDIFAKAKTGDEILLIGSSAEDASKLRRENDLRHFYQSLPTDEGKPNAYLAYVGITEKPPSEKVEFSLFPSKKVGIVTEDTVHYLKPKPGETLPEYARRQGMQSGKTMIPAENVFGASTERQVITPAAFEGNFGRYPGTKIVKVEDLGWTRYQENRLPEGLKDTKVGKLLSAVGVGQRYHKIEFSKWEKIPVTEPEELEPASVLERPKKQIKKLDIDEYSESYVPFREVTGVELGTRVFLGESGASSGSIESLSNPIKIEDVSPIGSDKSAKSISVKRSSRGSKSKISSSANEIKAELISDEIVSQSKSRVSKAYTHSSYSLSSHPSNPNLTSLVSVESSKSRDSELFESSPSKPRYNSRYSSHKHITDIPFISDDYSSQPPRSHHSVPSHPSTPSIPSIPSVPSFPSIPSIPSIPSTPSTPSSPSSPSNSKPSRYDYPENLLFPKSSPKMFRMPEMSKPRLFRLPKLVKREDWAVKPEITPKADWWAMTYTQAFLGLKARSPYRFDAKKRWLGDLESFGFGLTFPTKFIEEHRVRSYLDTTIEKAGLLDIVTGKRAKRKVNRAKKLSIPVPPAKVGFGAGLLPERLSGKSLKIDRTLLGTEGNAKRVKSKKRVVRVTIKPAKPAKSKSRKSRKRRKRRKRSKKKA